MELSSTGGGSRCCRCARMIGTFQIRLDVFKREESRLELLLGIKFGLIEVMLRRGVMAFTELQQGLGLRFLSKFNHAYEGVTDYAVSLLLPLCGR